MLQAQQAEPGFLIAPAQLQIVPPAPRCGPFFQRLGKRAVDLAAASAFLLIAAPSPLAAVVAVRISMGSGVAFRQPRVGHGGRDFDMAD
jgi:lipopolysaccharide/colanic/teichoic acid biosynthesis glycosyltransferase